MATFNTILIETNGFNVPVREAVADAGITPGHLLEPTATGVKVHATASGGAQQFWAVENPFINPSSTKAVNTAYVTGERVRFIVGAPGQVVWAWLADSNNAAINSPLGSAGDGTLLVITPGAGIVEGAIVGYAVEALNNTSGAAARLLVRLA